VLPPVLVPASLGACLAPSASQSGTLQRLDGLRSILPESFSTSLSPSALQWSLSRIRGDYITSLAGSQSEQSAKQYYSSAVSTLALCPRSKGGSWPSLPVARRSRWIWGLTPNPPLRLHCYTTSCWAMLSLRATWQAGAAGPPATRRVCPCSRRISGLPGGRGGFPACRACRCWVERRY
jgi:hypothetical protein